MPIRGLYYLYDSADPPNEIGIRVEGAGKIGVREFLYSEISGNSWNPNRIRRFTKIAQDEIDVRTPLSDPSLVDDEFGPGGVDPATVSPYKELKNFFWDGDELVARSCIIGPVWFEPGRGANGHLHVPVSLPNG